MDKALKEMNSHMKKLVEINEYRSNELLTNPRDKEVGDILDEVKENGFQLVQQYQLLQTTNCLLREILDEVRYVHEVVGALRDE